MDPYDAAIRDLGRYLIPIGLLLWGMTRVRSRRETAGANRSALLALEVALGSWVLLLLNAAFAPMLPGWLGVAGIAVPAVVGLSAAAIGAKGLWTGRVLRSGRLAAATGIIVGGGIAAILGWGFWSGYSRSRESAAVQSTTEQVGDLGLKWTPPAEWARLEPGQLNPRAQINYVRLKPDMAFIVIGETFPEGQRIDDDGVLAYLEQSLMVPKDTPSLVPTTTSVGGRQGGLVEVSEAGPGREHNYVVWYWHDGKSLLLLLVSARGDTVEPERLSQEARAVLAGVTFEADRRGG